MTTTEAEIRRQLIEVFGAATYPVTDPFELLPVLPDGPATTFEAGDVTIGARDLGREYADYQDSSYANVEALVDDLRTGLRADDLFS